MKYKYPNKSDVEIYKGHRVELMYDGRYSYYIYYNAIFIHHNSGYTHYKAAFEAAKRWINNKAPIKIINDNSQALAWNKTHRHGGSW